MRKFLLTGMQNLEELYELPHIVKFSIDSWEFLDEPSDKADYVLKTIIAE